MNFPTTIQFRGVDASDTLRAKIEEHAQHLNKFADDILSCRVVVSSERRPHHTGDLYRIDIHLVLGGREIHAGDSHAQDPRHDDPYVAVADAFNVTRRCIEDHVRRRRQATRPDRGAAKSA